MIAVVGEALVDLVVDHQAPHRPIAHPGGSPANVAVTLARLGTAVTFLGRSSHDPFGRLTRNHLADNGVDLSHLVEASEQASLAVVSVGSDGAASYTFHIAGAADWAWADLELPSSLPQETLAVHAGSLALAVDPGGPVLERWLAHQHRRRTISLDPNVRPALVGPRGQYRQRLESWVRYCDIVKISSEDLDWVYPGENAVEVGRRWLAVAGGPVLVVITFGADGSVALTGEREVHRPARTVEVADTVGAGDAFSGGLLDWLARRERLYRDALRTLTIDEAASAVDFASHVAAATCEAPGAAPPYRHDLANSSPGPDSPSHAVPGH